MVTITSPILAVGVLFVKHAVGQRVILQEHGTCPRVSRSPASRPASWAARTVGLRPRSYAVLHGSRLVAGHNFAGAAPGPEGTHLARGTTPSSLYPLVREDEAACHEHLRQVAQAQLVAQPPHHHQQDDIGRYVQVIEGRTGALVEDPATPGSGERCDSRARCAGAPRRSRHSTGKAQAVPSRNTQRRHSTRAPPFPPAFV